MIPTVAGFLFDAPEIARGNHAGNPVWVLDELDRHDNYGPLTIIGSIAGVALLLNSLRITRAIREVLAASRARRLALKAQRDARA